RAWCAQTGTIRNGAVMERTLRENERLPYWYERHNRPYRQDYQVVEGYATWLKTVPWQVFCTLTFGYKANDSRAYDVLQEFVIGLERHYRSDIAYLCGSEKRISGCGKPA